MLKVGFKGNLWFWHVASSTLNVLSNINVWECKSLLKAIIIGICVQNNFEFEIGYKSFQCCMSSVSSCAVLACEYGVLLSHKVLCICVMPCCNT